MKKYSKMTKDEKIEFLLEWANKTHNKLTEVIQRINDITDFIYEREGEAFTEIKPIKKIIN